MFWTNNNPLSLMRERMLNKNFIMNWKDLKPEIIKADKQINNSKGKYTEFYKRQRMFWNGYKRGIGMAFKIFKALNRNTDMQSEVLNIPRVSNHVCPYCGSTKVIAWGEDADKCEDCTLTWDV